MPPFCFSAQGEAAAAAKSLFSLSSFSRVTRGSSDGSCSSISLRVAIFLGGRRSTSSVCVMAVESFGSAQNRDDADADADAEVQQILLLSLLLESAKESAEKIKEEEEEERGEEKKKDG